MLLGALFCMGEGTKLQHRIGTKQQYLLDLVLLVTLNIKINTNWSRMHCPSHIQSGVHGGSAFTHLHLLLQLFLQRQWFRSLQLTPAAGSVTHCGCSWLSRPNVQPQFVGSGRGGLRAVAHILLDTQRASRLPFFVNKYFRASLTWNKYQMVSINKCKHYTITSPQEESEKIKTHLAEVASPVVN